MEIWILSTLLAVTMQSVCTAAQKQIAQSLSASTTTLIRYLFGWLFAFAYFFFLRYIYQEEAVVANAVFYRAASLAAAALLYMVLLQTTICLLFVLIRESSQLPLMLTRWRTCIFTGFSSLADRLAGLQR